ncbi:MAG: isocitrate/isopropylmalate family dehydrogenase, partial [Burkholderiales bacterium]
MQIGILEGDDIGLEVVPETIKVMKAAAQKCGLSVNWHPVPIGMKAYKELGHTLPPGTLEKLDTLDGWVLGPIGHQAYPKGLPNAINPHPILRKHYDLFANIRPAKSYAGLPSIYNDVDLIIVATSTPDFVFPSTACLVQKALGHPGGAAFDVQAVCSGFVYALA